MSSHDWTEAVDILTEAAMAKKLGSIEDVEIDAESYEEDHLSRRPRCHTQRPEANSTLCFSCLCFTLYPP